MRAQRRAVLARGAAQADRFFLRRRSTHRVLFMNNGNPSDILTGEEVPVIGRIPRTAGPLPWKPRQIRLSAGLPSARIWGCPQILWIKVCVSCKFGA
jgi:hypothetical protein